MCIFLRTILLLSIRLFHWSLHFVVFLCVILFITSMLFSMCGRWLLSTAICFTVIVNCKAQMMGYHTKTSFNHLYYFREIMALLPKITLIFTNTSRRRKIDSNFLVFQISCFHEERYDSYEILHLFSSLQMLENGRRYYQFVYGSCGSSRSRKQFTQHSAISKSRFRRVTRR